MKTYRITDIDTGIVTNVMAEEITAPKPKAPVRYTGHVPCPACGKAEWIWGKCPCGYSRLDPLASTPEKDGWRELGPDEVLEAGDQWWSGVHWIPAFKACGNTPTQLDCPARRKTSFGKALELREQARKLLEEADKLEGVGL